MEADDIIHQAMGSAGQMIGGKDLYVLEANAERNEFRILTAEEVMSNNMLAFANAIPTGYMFMGMYTTRQAAEESEEAIRLLLRGENGQS